MKHSSWLHGVVAVLMSAGAVQAGTVDVVFVEPQTYTDVYDSHHEAAENLQTLADYLQQLGHTYLPANQSLHVDVLDVDLAGRLQTTWRWGVVRVIGGRLDWPRMVLRYRLEEQGRVLSSEETTLADMAYSQRLDSLMGRDALESEKRMLRDWFRNQFAKH